MVVESYKTIQQVKLLAYDWSKFIRTTTVYLPILGPVYIGERDIKVVLEDLLLSTDKELFLSYDKNKRWFKEPPERIVLDKIKSSHNAVIIPVLFSTESNTSLKIFYYSINPLDYGGLMEIKGLVREIVKTMRVNGVRVYTQQQPMINDVSYSKLIFLKRIGDGDVIDKQDTNIQLFQDLSEEVQRGLDKLGEEGDQEGFRFLYRQWSTDPSSVGDILCIVKENQIVGAIGPIDIAEDAWGTRHLFSSYFGVKSDEQRRGYGGMLWDAAMDRAVRQGAEYALVQNTPQSPASVFYVQKGLVLDAEVYSFEFRH